MAANRKTVRAPGVQPTAERLSKGDYEGGKRRYRSNTLLSLRKAGRIDSAAESAAGDWVREVIYAAAGYTDPAAEVRIEFDETGAPILGDAITANLSRSRHSELLKYVAEILGRPQEEKLWMMLIEGLSFRSMAEQLLPEKSVERGTSEMAVACANILCVLPGAFAMARKYQRDRRMRDIEKSGPARRSRIRAAEFTGPS